MSDEEEFPGWGWYTFFIVCVVCVTAYEIAKLFAR